TAVCPHGVLSPHFTCKRGDLPSLPPRRSSDLLGDRGGTGHRGAPLRLAGRRGRLGRDRRGGGLAAGQARRHGADRRPGGLAGPRSEEHTSELQSRENLVCRLLLEKKKDEV